MKIRTRVSCLLLALMVVLTFVSCTDGGASSQSEASSQVQSLPSEQSTLPVSSEPEEEPSPYPYIRPRRRTRYPSSSAGTFCFITSRFSLPCWRTAAMTFRRIFRRCPSC